MNDAERQRLERFHGYLTFLARLLTAGRSRAKLDVSGIVQQTLIEAHQAINLLSEWSDDRQAAWLRQALNHNLADEIRRLGAQKRDVRLEQSLEASIDHSMSRLQQLIPTNDSTPSLQAHKNEQLLRLAAAINQLPETQRQVVEWHHLLGWPLADVAEHLGTTKPAVAGLLHRGLKKLRESMSEPDESA